nr:MAG TPA: hypothetical protein [Caudoviricetes sp.]
MIFVIVLRKEFRMGAVYDKYYKEVYKDACDVADENFDDYLESDFDDAWDEFYEDLYMDDSVTGNASGSYWFSRKKAEESLGEFVWDEDIVWLLEEMGDRIEDVVNRGPEVADVIIRCAMLGHVEGAVKEYVWEMYG